METLSALLTEVRNKNTLGAYIKKEKNKQVKMGKSLRVLSGEPLKINKIKWFSLCCLFSRANLNKL